MSDLLAGLDRLPDRPQTTPLDWQRHANAFDAFVMDPANQVRYETTEGRPAFWILPQPL